MKTSLSLDGEIPTVKGSSGTPFSPYSRPQSTANPQDNKQSMIWRDFMHSVNKRKGVIERLKDAAGGSSTSLSVLKKTLLELRQITLAVIEDALEVEYHSRLTTAAGSRQSRRGGRTMKLPPINSFTALHEHEEIYPMSEIINDCEELFSIPNIKVILPVNFPSIRNPFMLGKTVDELATIVPPHPEPGNMEDELKSLELLRYKRASRALLRAEAQVLNRLPINLYDIERVLDRMKDDPNIEMLIRAVCTLIDNDRNDRLDQEADLTCLVSPIFNVEPHELIRKLNEFRGVIPMRVDVKVFVHQKLRACTLDYLLAENIPKFLFEWIQTVIGDVESAKEAAATFSQNEDQRKSANSSRKGLHSSVGSRASMSNLALQPLQTGRISTTSDTSDLASFVDSRTGYVKTNEKIHEVQEPRRKTTVKIISPPRSPPNPLLSRTQDSSFLQQGKLVATNSKSEGFSSSQSSLHQKSVKRERGSTKGDDLADDTSVGSFSISSAHSQKVGMSIKKKIRMEVEKAVRDIHAGKHLLGGFGIGGQDADEEHKQTVQFDAISSVRYELNKMQQELLRRQVLDPRHYAVTSIDSVTHANNGLTVDNINAFDPLEKRRRAPGAGGGGSHYQDERKLMPVEIASKWIKVETKEREIINLLLSIVFRPETKDLFCTIAVAYDDGVKYHLIKDESETSLHFEKVPQVLAHFIISQLIFSRITEYTMEDLIEANVDTRKRMMQNVFEQLILYANRKPLPRGSVIPDIDRLLFQKQFAEDNVLVHLVIARNDECNGCLVTCTPIAGLFGHGIGPVTLVLSDNELEVLLISQHGLFLKAKNRWQSMVVVAGWIGGRVHVRKVETNTNIEVTVPKDKTAFIAEDMESVGSQVTFSPRGETSTVIVPVSNNKSPMKQKITNPNVTTTTQPLLMLEIYVDRHLDISSSLIEHWKSRNLPRILGLEANIIAYQDLEILHIEISILVPSKLTHKKLLDEEEAKTGGQHHRNGGKKKKRDVLALDSDDDDVEDHDGYDEDRVTEVKLSYRLTRPECLIFGTTELIENKKISMSKNMNAPMNAATGGGSSSEGKDSHPEGMLWNIFNRLKINFKGSKSEPFKSASTALDPENWGVHYDRLLVRDVKTVSQSILMMKASAIGGDLLLEAVPVDANQKVKLGKKIVSERELKETVYSEGWEVSLFEYVKRKDLATLILDKLKLVSAENDPDYEQRIELYSFIETKMLSVTLMGTGNEMDQELGSVEISSHHTLTDLRVIMKHELDNDDLPTQYRFLYKGTVCSLRQETFRRAWECLPICFITPKAVQTGEMGTETDDIARRRLEKHTKKEGPKIPRLTKSQRRVAGKWIAIPVPTLCIVEEGKSVIYFLNEAKELLTPGDIIRVGNAKSRDYIVTKIGTDIKHTLDEKNYTADSEHDTNLKSIEIEPEYDLIGEPDFNTPVAKNFPFPLKNVGLFMDEKGKVVNLLKTKESLGYNYHLPKELYAILYPKAKPEKVKKAKKKKNETMNKLLRASQANLGSALALLMNDDDNNTATQTMGSNTENGGGDSVTENENDDEDEDDEDEMSVPPGRTMTPSHLRMDRNASMKSMKSSKSLTKKGNKSQKNLGIRIFTDVWMWKCIPAKDDNRPKWKQQYDDGEVHYTYDYLQSDDFFEHFRVKAYYSYLEILCTDSRCSYLSLYSQRVNEMKSIPIEYYTKLIFDKMTDWSPIYKKGIEKTKFLKLIRDVTAFPDLKRPARMSQIETYFMKTVKSSFGIVQKYISYPGFCQLIKELSILRFPQRKTNKEAARAAAADGQIAESSLAKKLEKGKADAKDANDDDSVMTDDVSSLASNEELNNNNKDKSKHPRARRMLTEISLTTVDAEGHNENNVLFGIDPEYIQYAYSKFILDFLMMFPTWYENPWKEVKLIGMQKESIRYCAVTRIIATFRGFLQKKKYQFFLKNHIRLQSQIRRKLAYRKYVNLLKLLYQDYFFRYRYHCMVRVQALARRYIKRCWYVRIIDQLKRQQVILIRARRQKLKKINEIRKKALVFTEVKKINGVIVLIRVFRKDPRNYTKDFGISIEVYIPKTQGLFKFPLEDPDLRSYLSILLEKPVLATGDLLNKNNLRNLLTTRLLILKNKHTLPTVIFSRHALGQKGEKILTHAISIAKEYFICKIFETVEDITVQCYHVKTSKIFTPKIVLKELIRWIKDEFLLEAIAMKNKVLHEKTSRLQKQQQQQDQSPLLLTNGGRGASRAGSPGKQSPQKLKELQEKSNRDFSKSQNMLVALQSNDLFSVKSTDTDDVIQERLKNKANKKLEIDVSKPIQQSINNDANEVMSVITDNPDDMSVSAEEELLQLKAIQPMILKPENKKKYYEWILRHIVIDTRKGKFVLLFKNQLEKSKKRECLIKIQAHWRRALVRPRIIEMLDKIYLKVKVSTLDPACYYLHRYNGVSTWEKPKLLGNHDLYTQPIVSHWVPVYYQHEGITYTHYVNPFTGLYTHLLPDQAARKIQHLARKHLLKVIRMPKVAFMKAAAIFKTAEELYYSYENRGGKKPPQSSQGSRPVSRQMANTVSPRQPGEDQPQIRRKLAHVINYAIVLHVVDCNEALAKEVYREAVDLSESNPLVTRCYAFFLLSTCEPPLQLNRERALLLLQDAKRKDEDHSRFEIAFQLFQFGVLRSPMNPVALVNMALVHCILYNNNYLGEKLIRRALSLAPFEERVMEIWKYLKNRFPERTVLYNPMSRINKMKSSIQETLQQMSNDKRSLKTIHGRPAVENSQWAGWVYIPEDVYKASRTIKGIPYWYNPADGKESIEPPDFQEQWAIRKTRSHYQLTEYGLEQYFDPLTSDYFQYHPLTNTYS
jgi:hypothetical protein